MRELREGLAGLVRRAGAGETIVVTVSGRPVATLGPVGERATPTLDDLVAVGAVLGPRAGARPATGAPAPLAVDARSAVELRKVR